MSINGVKSVNRYLMICALAIVGCGSTSMGSYPAFSDPYKAKQPDLVTERPGENIAYHHEDLGSPEFVEMSRNQDITIADRDKKAACYQFCSEENEKRRETYFKLIEARKYVKGHCTPIGYSGVAVTSEDSPTAHNRIEEDEGTGELVYRERTIHVVGVRPKWKCPSDTNEFTLDIAEHWMYMLPAGVEQKYCNKIKDSAFTGIPLETCQRWVTAD